MTQRGTVGFSFPWSGVRRCKGKILVPRPEDLFLNESKRSFPCNDGSCPCANALPTKGVKNHKEKGKEKGEEKGKEKGKE